MPTIKDIAKHAGVSHGTVSNVLNHRGNVSAEKIQLVEQAARELGYQLNAQAQQLRAGLVKKVCVILPGLNTRRYQDFFAGLEPVLRAQGVETSLFCTDRQVLQEEAAVGKAKSMHAMAIVSISALRRNRGLYDDDIPLYFVERQPKQSPANSVFTGFSYEEIGRDIAERCLRDGHRSVALLCGEKRYADRKAFLNGAAAMLEENGCEYRLYASENALSLLEAFEVLRNETEFDAVLTADEEDIDFLQRAADFYGRRAPRIYGPCSHRLSLRPQEGQYILNYRLLGQRLGERILSDCLQDAGNVGEPKLLLAPEGFRRSEAVAVSEKASVLNYLTIQNATSHAIRLLLPAFERESGIHVNMSEASYDELYKMAADCADSSPYDLLRIDLAWMDELGSRIYQPLPTGLKAAEHSLPTLDLWGCMEGQRYALPLDACVQMLFYRKDLFEDELIKREFFEQYHRKLAVPESFSEFDALARFFTRSLHPSAVSRYGCTETYGRAVLAACDFLPRCREKLSGREAEAGLQLDAPAIREALENYLSVKAATDGNTYQWWTDSTRAFSEGETAMHIVFSNYASAMLHGESSQVTERLGFADVPGRRPLLGGGWIGISRHSQKTEAALRFLDWLYRRDIAELICYLGGYVASRELQESCEVRERYPWIEHMERSFSMGTRCIMRQAQTSLSQRSPLREMQLEAILGRAVRSAAGGIETAEAALARAQAELERIKN